MSYKTADCHKDLSSFGRLEFLPLTCRDRLSLSGMERFHLFGEMGINTSKPVARDKIHSVFIVLSRSEGWGIVIKIWWALLKCSCLLSKSQNFPNFTCYPLNF